MNFLTSLKYRIAPPTAKQIQTSIVSAQDALIKEARTIVAAPTPNDEHADRLMRLGFTSSTQVSERLKQRKEATEKLARIAECEAAAMKYPGFRYVEGEVMDAVCKQYGLLIGGVDRYMGEVPEWAANAIERSGIVKTGWGSMYTWMDLDGQKNTFEPDFYSYEKSEAQDFVDRLNRGSSVARRLYELVRTTDRPLLIAAPKRQMRVNPGERIEGNRIVVRDPIVMIKEGSGYVVLAAWDEEGRDPRILNPASN